MMRGTLIATCVVILLMSETTSAFRQTNKLLRDLNLVESTARNSLACPTGLTAPNDLDGLVTTATGLYSNLTALNGLLSTTNSLLSGLLLIPGINYITSPILVPITTSVTWLTRAISVATTAVEPVVNSLNGWTGSLQTTKDNGAATKSVLLRVITTAGVDKTYLTQLATEISKVQCTVRASYLQTLEAAATGKDAAPNALNVELQRSKAVCNEIQNFVTTTNAKINNDVLKGFQIANEGLTIINSGLEPIQKYIQAIDNVLDAKLCLSDINRVLRENGLDEIVDMVIKKGGEIIDVIVDTGEDVIDAVSKKAEEIIDDIFGSWGRRRRRSLKLLRKKRDLCISPRDILDGSIAVDGGVFTAVEFVFKKFFNTIVPGIPAFTGELEKLASGLLPIESDFDLGGKAGQLILSNNVVSAFLDQSYPSIFTNRPAPAQITQSASTVCPGGVALLA